MASLTDNDLYLQRIEVNDEIPDNNYLSFLPVVRGLKEAAGITLTSPVTIFVGENGVGKSTLVEAMASNQRRRGRRW